MVPAIHKQEETPIDFILGPRLIRELLFQHPLDKLDKSSQRNEHINFDKKHVYSDTSHHSHTDMHSVEQDWEGQEEGAVESNYGSDMDSDGIAELREFRCRIQDWVDEVYDARKFESGSGNREIDAKIVAKELKYQEWRRDEKNNCGNGHVLYCENEYEEEERKWEGLVKDTLFVLGRDSDDSHCSLHDSDDSEVGSGLSFLEKLERFETRQVIKKERKEMEEEYFDAVEEVVEDLNDLLEDEEYDSDCQIGVHGVKQERWIEDYKNLKEEDSEVKASDAWEKEDEEEDYGEEMFSDTGEVLGALAVGAMVLWVL